MNNLLQFEDLRVVCRICLNKNKVLILLNNYLYGNESKTSERPLISNVLEDILSAEIGNSHPRGICSTCLDQVKSAYNFKLQLKKSEQIIRECEASIIASYIKDDNFEIFDSDSNDDSQVHFESISATDYIPKTTVEYSYHDSSELNNEMKEISSGNIENCSVKSEWISIENVEKMHDSSELNNEMKIYSGDIENCSVKSESMSIENVEEVGTKKQTNIIKLQINNKIHQDNIQVRYLDSNKFVIERKPVVSNEHLEENSSLDETKCLSCGEVYSKEEFKSHVIQCIKIKTTFACEECHKVFRKVKNLNFHVKSTHRQDPLPCRVCGIMCANYNAKQVHMRKCHRNGKNFICEICSKGFYYNAALLKHKSKHTRETQEVCNICGKSYHYQGALFYHMKIHTNERKYLCTFCDRKFYTTQALKRHIDAHTGERRYKCQYCEKSFRSSSERRRHEMIHTGEKPYQCNYCDKGFISKYNHDIHTASHRGEQPCDMCSGKYLNAEVLQLHLRFKHKVKLEDIQSLE